MIVGTLGTYIKSKQAPTYKTDYLRKGVWISGQHNMGMVVDRAFYDNLKLNAAKYCFYDDYNWESFSKTECLSRACNKRFQKAQHKKIICLFI